MRIIILALLVYTNKAIAQQSSTPMFQTVIWFEDAIGNRDSVTIGFDLEAKWDTLNPNFGEALLDTPFDSIFEVRVSHLDNWDMYSDRKFTKVKISKARKSSIGSPCYGLWPSGIYVHAKYMPVKVTWDPTIFQTSCLTMSYMGLHTTDVHIDDWNNVFDNIMNYTQCFAEDSTFTFSQPDSLDLFKYWYNRFPYILSNGDSADLSVLAIRLRGLNWGSFNNPCQGIVPIATLEEGNRLRLYSNPVGNELYLQVDEGYNDIATMRYAIIHISGKAALEGIISPHQSVISVETLHPGMYHIQLFSPNGFRLFSSFFVKQ